MKKNYAFIFARGGSKELKNKNIKLFNGKLESRLAKYEIYSGTKKIHKQLKK